MLTRRCFLFVFPPHAVIPATRVPTSSNIESFLYIICSLFENEFIKRYDRYRIVVCNLITPRAILTDRFGASFARLENASQGKHMPSTPCYGSYFFRYGTILLICQIFSAASGMNMPTEWLSGLRRSAYIPRTTDVGRGLRASPIIGLITSNDTGRPYRRLSQHRN